MEKKETQKECPWYFVCPMKRYFKEGKLEKHWIEDYCHGKWDTCIRFKKEKEGRYHPDEMLPDGSIDTSLSP